MGSWFGILTHLIQMSLPSSLLYERGPEGRGFGMGEILTFKLLLLIVRFAKIRHRIQKSKVIPMKIRLNIVYDSLVFLCL
jgi:hypothetical protein